jgi:hypothetical protein
VPHGYLSSTAATNPQCAELVHLGPRDSASHVDWRRDAQIPRFAGLSPQARGDALSNLAGLGRASPAFTKTHYFESAVSTTLAGTTNRAAEMVNPREVPDVR